MPWEDVAIENSQGCCALDEIVGLDDDPVQNLLAVSEYRRGANGDADSHYMSTFYVFSDDVAAKCGTKLAKYIVDNKLGLLTETKAAKNPKSNHNVKVWVWTCNGPKLEKWAAKHQKDLEWPDEDDEDEAWANNPFHV